MSRFKGSYRSATVESCGMKYQLERVKDNGRNDIILRDFD